MPRNSARIFFCGFILMHVLLLTTGLSKAAVQSMPIRPKTIEEAAQIVKAQWLSAAVKDWILRNPENVVHGFLHLTLGVKIRNEFGLWSDNTALLKSCGGGHPDDCSGKIITQMRNLIRAENNPELINRLDHQFKLLTEVPIRYKGFRNMRTNQWLSSIRSQIESALKKLNHDSEEKAKILVRVQGNPDPNCFTRAEFSEDGKDPIPLSLFLSWFSFRNAFSVQHDPPYIDLSFSKKCAWPEKPTWFKAE